MRKARFEFSEVALSQVEQVYSTIKKLVKSNLYDSLYHVLNNTTLSAKQYYHLLDELIDDNLFNDVKFAKILFSSELQANNDEYCNLLGEPLAQSLLYNIYNGLKCDLVYELFIDENSKIRFDKENINLDNILQVLMDLSNKFSSEQFTKLTQLFVIKKKISVTHINDYGKTALDLFLYRQRINNDVFDILIKKYNTIEKEKIEEKINTKIENYLKYANNEYKSLSGMENLQNRINLRKKEYNRLFN